MNDDQLKHIASVFNLMAFAEFGAFGYAAINAHPVAWVKLALAAAGFINLQWFAREATSRLFEKCLNPMDVSAITGHKTLQMLKRYIHPRAEDLAKRMG